MFVIGLLLLLLAPLIGWIVGPPALQAQIRQGHALYYAGVLFTLLFLALTRG